MEFAGSGEDNPILFSHSGKADRLLSNIWEDGIKEGDEAVEEERLGRKDGEGKEERGVEDVRSVRRRSWNGLQTIDAGTVED